jgi:hypothetical protein
MENLKAITRNHSFTNDKILEYLKKSETVEKTDRIRGQIEALELVRDWLNQPRRSCSINFERRRFCLHNSGETAFSALQYKPA